MRRAVLTRLFALLYGPLAWLHEPAGLALAGAAWHGRRAMAIDPPPDGVLLDVGCGEGRLLAQARRAGVTAIGIDSSTVMTRRARRRGALVVRASASALPIASDSIARVTSTYPGEWIFDDVVLRELARVLRPDGDVRILIGGSTRRGRLAGARRLVARCVYGASGGDAWPGPRSVAGLDGAMRTVEDGWGESIWWIGRRVG